MLSHTKHKKIMVYFNRKFYLLAARNNTKQKQTIVTVVSNKVGTLLFI